MRIFRTMLMGITLLGWATAGLCAQAMGGGQTTTSAATVPGEGAMETLGMQSHGGGAIAYGGAGGGRSSGVAFGAAGAPAQPGGPYGMHVAIGPGMPYPSVVVVPTSKVDSEAFTGVADGIRVMSHILRQNLTKGHGPATAVFTDYGDLLGGNRGRLDGLYVQGYGVFLFTEVRLAQPAPSEEQVGQGQGKEPAADPVWERARQELEARAEGGSMGMPGGMAAPGGAGYGAVMVQSVQPGDDGWEAKELTTELIKTFKHTANIRPLAADELVTLSVMGRISTGGADHYVVRRQVFGSQGQVEKTAEQIERAGGSGTKTFTLSARKSDIDQFAQGQLSLDQFRQKVKVFAY